MSRLRCSTRRSPRNRSAHPSVLSTVHGTVVAGVLLLTICLMQTNPKPSPASIPPDDVRPTAGVDDGSSARGLGHAVVVVGLRPADEGARR